MNFQEKVSDLKAKRRLLEISRSEMVRNIAIHSDLAEFKSELNPKLLPGSFKFYANPKHLLSSEVAEHLKDFKR